MNTVYLIGNGFDINLGLPTKYIDFYNYYLKLLDMEDSPGVTALKKHLKDCLSNEDDYWSDLEIALGNYTENFESFDQLEPVYDHLHDSMQTYLRGIENSLQSLEMDRNLLMDNIHKPERFLLPRDKETITELYGKYGGDNFINVVSFNYTSTIERILNFDNNFLELGPTQYSPSRKAFLNRIYHVHGSVNQPILGVNDYSQIRNTQLASDLDLQDFLIKPQINENTGYLIDRSAHTAIRQANLICIYGMSLGATDADWWKEVGELLITGKKVILFVYDKNRDELPVRKLGRFKRDWVKRFIEIAAVPETFAQKVENNLIISRNNPIFDIKPKFGKQTK